ncbi:MAG: hypothetical protein QM774_00220 [Gordonia sp. (in: high G+C Gram-positive bacteria)]|uniref:hypothetical protein n=1 Tax=Gordonia sp. (in: high G+C Gram-positive bacteria) TaxID=84139 RepID=UPI0039E48E62
MPLCSEEALETALRQLSRHAASNKYRSNWLSTYLAAKRAEAAGYGLSINGVNQAVEDLFALIPDHPKGRISPFLDLSSKVRWLKVKDSGRSTVWNTGTRDQSQTVLFKPSTRNSGRGYFGEGLLPNAADIAVLYLDDDTTDDPLPGRDALAVLVTRSHDWAAEPSRDELHEAAQDYLGMTPEEFKTITEDVTIGVPVLGSPEWSPVLLAASELGPPEGTATQPGTQQVAHEPEITVEDVEQLPEQFRGFLNHHGIATESEDELVDLLAATLSSQLIIMAGPSGSGKSLMASALAAFFAPQDRRARLESSRLLAKREEFFGYFSHLAGQSFQILEPLQLLLDIAGSDGETPPIVTVEEANLSPIEGYLSPLVHGLGGLEAETLSIPLHNQDAEQKVPRALELEPYPRFFATINVDADSPAPARKVVSRACVMLMEAPSFDTALAAADTLVHPSVEDGTGPAAGLIGRPTLAFDRYSETGSDVFQQALKDRAELLRNVLGSDVIAHRPLQRSLIYMAWYAELLGVTEPEPGDPIVEAAADNALLHFVLPVLSAKEFEGALSAFNADRSGVLGPRLARLEQVANAQQFGPPPDFWGALT